MQAIRALVTDVDYCAKADILLKAQAGVASFGNRSAAGPLGNILRSEYTLQRGKLVDVAIECRRFVSHRRLSGHTVNLIAIQAIVEHSKAATDRGLSVAEDIQ